MARDVGEALRQLMKERQSTQRACEWHLSAGKEWKKWVLKFFFYTLLLLCLPKMNWLFRFKKVHGWNTKRGSSISPRIVRENPMAVWRREDAEKGVRCWSLIRPWASSTQGLAAQTSILSSSTSNPLNHLRQFFHCKPPYKYFPYQMCQHYVSMNTYCNWAVHYVKF